MDGPPEYFCHQCNKNIYYQQELRMFTPGCKHRICSACLEETYSRKTNVPCRICNRSLKKNDYVSKDDDEIQVEGEKSYRKKVFDVYNKSRRDFKLTPEYNSFLEEREDIVYILAYSTDKKEREMAEEKMRAYERENAALIQANKQRADEERKRKIRDIVEKEGTFYELVRHNPTKPGMPPPRKETLVHPLKRQYRDLFADDEALAAVRKGALHNTTFAPKPLDPAGKPERDVIIERGAPNERQRRETRKLAGGYKHDRHEARRTRELYGTLML
eukprot:GDKI01046921.1.p1 GENE.GDKI01046921.1~~GDKI01046921.1.p1  ORF type:complete len:274 (+),score=86.08 GDKI01046921.1:128-949(+)